MPRKMTDGKGDVHWYFRECRSRRQRPDAYSTQAVNYFICLLAEQGLTFQQMKDMFERKELVRDPDVEAILDGFIKHGHGNTVARTVLRTK